MFFPYIIKTTVYSYIYSCSVQKYTYSLLINTIILLLCSSITVVFEYFVLNCKVTMPLKDRLFEF